MTNQKNHYVIMYDIQDSRRLRQIAKLLKAYGIRVQKSVFECLLDEKQLTSLKQEMEKTIREQDSIRFYPMEHQAQHKQLILGEAMYTTAPSQIVVI